MNFVKCLVFLFYCCSGFDVEELKYPTLTYETRIELRDQTGFLKHVSHSRPDDGWKVSPVHHITLPNGKVLVLGWNRRSAYRCPAVGFVVGGVSFLVNPEEFIGLKVEQQVYNIEPLDEVEDVFSGPYQDVLTFCGHNSLPDGNILLVGGVRFDHWLGNWDKALDYARIYDYKTNKFHRVRGKMPFGTAWYPTSVALPDGRSLLIQGFVRCCEGYESSAIATFDFERYKNNRTSPWEAIQKNSETPIDLSPISRDYSRLFVLYQPVKIDGLLRQVAVMGAKGEFAFLNTNRYLPQHLRWGFPPNRHHPANCGSETSSTILATGELAFMGGCDKKNLNLYNANTDSWRTIDMGIERHYSILVLLPNGWVLVIAGSNELHQNTPDQEYIDLNGDARIPQLFDPFTNEIINMTRETPTNVNSGYGPHSPFRGYHSSANLLADGRVLFGGGMHRHGGIGCEHPSFRVFNPPYIHKERPRIISLSGTELTLDSKKSSIIITYDSNGHNLLASSNTNASGVVLLHPSAQTHAYDQNERYVPLEYKVLSEDKIEIYAPETPLGVPGAFFLFLVDEFETPSESKTVHLLPTVGNWYRTVVFVHFNPESTKQKLLLHAGHSDVLSDVYKSRENETIFTANPLVRTKLTWGKTHKMSWTTNEENNEKQYYKDGYGRDPENNMGENFWKFEFYMKKGTGKSELVDQWFEFKITVIEEGKPDIIESDINHVTIMNGEQPPTSIQTKNHWAKRGAVTTVIFNENVANIYDLNEKPILIRNILP